MQAALSLTLIDSSRSCFKQTDSYVDKVNRISCLKTKEITLRNRLLKPIISSLLLDITSPKLSKTMTENFVVPKNPISITGDVISGDDNEPLIKNVVDLQNEIVAAVKRQKNLRIYFLIIMIKNICFCPVDTVIVC